MPTLSDVPPERTNTVVVVVVVIVVDVARGRNEEKYNAQPVLFYCFCFSVVLHLIAIYLTSETILLQCCIEAALCSVSPIDSSI